MKITDQHNYKTPLNPWAFIRVCNEDRTLEASLNSILGAINRGVIAYNDCTDNSERIILDFCAKHKGFIPAKYPHKIITPRITRTDGTNMKRFKTIDDYLASGIDPQTLPPVQNRLSTYYNFALSFIPKDEWFIKIDCDHVYDADELKESFKLIKKDNEALSIPRINIVIKDKEIFIELYKNNQVIRDPGDHLLIKNTDVKFCDAHWGGALLEAYDLPDNTIILKTASLNNIHFPYIKTNRLYSQGKLIKLEDFLESEEAKDSRINNDILSADFIINAFKKFNLIENYIGLKYLNNFAFTNISYNKPATQSSTSEWSCLNDATRALNGELTNENFAFHTNLEENPWWMVDLEKEEYIYNIYIKNRIQDCKERAKTLQVEISLDKENWTLIPNEYLKWENLDYLNVELLNKYKARYVKLSLREKNYFHLAKVEVYALNDKVIEACRNLDSKLKEKTIKNSNNTTNNLDDDLKANIAGLIKKQNEILEKLL